MRIDLNAARMQARQMQKKSIELQDARFMLISFKNELMQHWKGQEMTDIIGACDQILGRLSSSFLELEAIAALIVPQAEEVKRAEDLPLVN